MARNPVRHLVLDNEAAQTLSSIRTGDQRRAAVVEAIVAANGRVVVPTAVRVAAGWRRRDHGAANANRLVGNDVALDRVGADRAVQLRRLVPAASVVDTTVAVAAERMTDDVAHAIVEVLTSDIADISALAVHVRVRVDVVALCAATFTGKGVFRS